MTCTVPKILGIQTWFDARFKDLCEAHDAAYMTRAFSQKYRADIQLAHAFHKRGYTALGLVSLPYTFIFGTLYFLWKKYK